MDILRVQYLDWQETGVCREDCKCERDPEDVHGKHTFSFLSLPKRVERVIAINTVNIYHIVK